MKIVYFDYWIKGIHHFKIIDSELKKNKHETLFLHIGSFKNKCKKEEIVDGIICRDISFYNTNFVYKMLEKERPNVVITLNTSLLFDRVVTLSCRKLNIKTIFLMHGNMSFGNSYQDVIDLYAKSFNKISVKIKKIYKYALKVIPNYIYTLSKYNYKLLLKFNFLKIILSYINIGEALYNPKYTEELLQDKCLVYSKKDMSYYKKIGYKEKDIVIVGNPKYSDLLDKIKNNKFSLDLLPREVKELIVKGKKYALILDDGFPEAQNLGGITFEDRNEFIHSIAKRLEKENISLIVKLHPNTKKENVRITNKNVLVCDLFLDPLIYYSYFCISSISTTINNCVLMNKPVLCPFWEKYKNIPTFYIDEGITNKWNNIDDNLNLEINEKARKIFIEEYITITESTAVQNIIRVIIVP